MPRFFSSFSRRSFATGPNKKLDEVKPASKKLSEEDEEEEKFDYAAARAIPKSKLERIITWAFFTLLGGYVLSLVLHKFGKLKKDGPTAPFYRMAESSNNAYKFVIELFTMPASRKLLPDMPKGMPYTPKTFVLNMCGTLVHPDYKMGVGYEITKRPGLDWFLQRLAKLGEVVVFSNDDLMLINDMYVHVDPNHSIFTALFGRESMVFQNQKLHKDLQYLNRDLSNVIVIDWDLEKLDRQPDNVIALTKFSGDINDRELIDLLPFLEHLASPGVTDVRKEILKYRSEEGGYKKFMEDLMESKKKLVQQKNTGLGGIMSSLGKPAPKRT